MEEETDRKRRHGLNLQAMRMRIRMSSSIRITIAIRNTGDEIEMLLLPTRFAFSIGLLLLWFSLTRNDERENYPIFLFYFFLFGNWIATNHTNHEPTNNTNTVCVTVCVYALREARFEIVAFLFIFSLFFFFLPFNFLIHIITHLLYLWSLK